MSANDVPAALVNHPRQMVLDDPQLRHNQLLFESRHPNAGRLLQPRPPAQFDSAPFALVSTQTTRPLLVICGHILTDCLGLQRHHAPVHGGSTREVLAEILPEAEASGELDRLEQSGVVAQRHASKE